MNTKTNKFNSYSGLCTWQIPQGLIHKHGKDKVEIILRNGIIKTERIMNINWKATFKTTDVVGWRIKIGAKCHE